MRALATRGSRVDIRAYEVAALERITDELRPQTTSLLAEARSLIGSLLDTCEVMDRPHPSLRSSPPYDVSRVSDRRFERAVDAAVASNIGSLQAIEEVAFIAQIELRQRNDRLHQINADWECATLIGECDSSLRRMRKSLSAVDLTIANVLGVPPLLDYTSELESSLAVRHALAKFRMRATRGGTPDANNLRARFQLISTQIEIMVGWDIYPGMRIRDRLLLRDLQQRLLAWLEADNAPVTAGIRLWGDIAASLEMFGQVNRRQELLGHDIALLKRSIAELKTHETDQEVDSTVWRSLWRLEGLDLELDELFTRPAPPKELLLIVLNRLLAQLCPPSNPPAASEPPW